MEEDRVTMQVLIISKHMNQLHCTQLEKDLV